MINLLPDDKKRDISAARMNVILLRYNFMTIIALALLLAICLVFYLILSTSQSSATSKSTDNSSRAAQYAPTRKAAEEYRSNLTIANQVLSNSVNYTSVVFGITKLLPKGVVLDAVSLKASDFGQQTTFTARAKSYDQATQLKDSFQKSDIFTNVFFESVTSNSGNAEGSESSYPISIALSAKLNKVPM